MTRARRRRLPSSTIALSIIAVLLAASFAVLVTLRRGESHGGLSSAEQRAVDAARVEMANVFTHSRSSFDADVQHALDGATGQLQQQIQSTEATLKNTLDTAKTDSVATVTGAGFEAAKGSSSLVLVSVSVFRVDSAGTRTQIQQTNFEVTMTDVKGKWLAASATAVELA